MELYLLTRGELHRLLQLAIWTYVDAKGIEDEIDEEMQTWAADDILGRTSPIVLSRAD